MSYYVPDDSHAEESMPDIHTDITQSDVNLLDLAINRVASKDELRRAREVVGNLTEMLRRKEAAPTPHSDLLDLEAIRKAYERAIRVNTTTSLHAAVNYIPALLSRLEAAEKRAGLAEDSWEGVLKICAALSFQERQS